MAFDFGDGMDCYAAATDMDDGYWDSSTGSITSWGFVAGRFAGSQALSMTVGNISLVKSSAVNDAVHHIVLAFRQTAAVSGTTSGAYVTLSDGTTAQCSIVFQSGGNILLTSGAPGGTVLDTYTGAVALANTWYAFEFEIAINNTTGSWAVRKNGNPSNDRALGSLDTQNSANPYANKITLGMTSAVNAQQVDDLYWRSSAATGSFLSDIRCYTRAPASDASVQFSKAPQTLTQTPFAQGSNNALPANVTRYAPFVSPHDGTISTATVSVNANYTGNLKCAIFSSTGSAPASVLSSTTIIVNPTAGTNTIAFITPAAVVKGSQYWLGIVTDAATAAVNTTFPTSTGVTTPTTYAAFPVATPTPVTTGLAQQVITFTVTISANYGLVAEAQQDTTASYVYDSVVGHSDLYGIAAIASTPLTTFAVTTRAYAIKSDAGTRTMAVQLKSGGTTVASPTVVLTPSNWQWAWRHDTTDPATGAAWTAAAVNVCSIGPTVIA